MNIFIVPFTDHFYTFLIYVNEKTWTQVLMFIKIQSIYASLKHIPLCLLCMYLSVNDGYQGGWVPGSSMDENTVTHKYVIGWCQSVSFC